MIGALGEVVLILERVGVPYAVIGGVAARHYGVPRATYDVDIMIPPLSTSQGKKLADFFIERGFSLETKRARKILEKGGIVRTDWGGVTVVDFVVRKRAEPILKRAVEVEGIKVISLEDLVLEKLLVIRKARRGTMRFQDKEDVEVLLAIHEGRLDLGYLRREARKAGTAGLLSRLLKKAPRCGKRYAKR